MAASTATFDRRSIRISLHYVASLDRDPEMHQTVRQRLIKRHLMLKNESRSSLAFPGASEATSLTSCWDVRTSGSRAWPRD
jgi:hypothetical protein